MKAIVQIRYGSPHELQHADTEKPAPKDDEVLIKVHAASVNSWDWDMERVKPLSHKIVENTCAPENALTLKPAQLDKSLDAVVTVVDSAEKLDMLYSLGEDHMID